MLDDHRGGAGGGKGGQQVEEAKQDISQKEIKQHVEQAWLAQIVGDHLGLSQAGGRLAPKEKNDGNQQRRNGKVDQRPGNDDQKLLDRLFRHPFQVGNTADRQQQDAARLDAEAPRGQGMAILMQGDADKEQRNRQHAIQAAHQPAGRASPIEKSAKGQHQDKRPMHLDVDTQQPKLGQIFAHLLLTAPCPTKRRGSVTIIPATAACVGQPAYS